MAYKSVLAVIDTAGETDQILDASTALAERFGAHIVGLYADPEEEAGRFRPWASLIRSIWRGLRRRARITRRRSRMPSLPGRHGKASTSSGITWAVRRRATWPNSTNSRAAAT